MTHHSVTFASQSSSRAVSASTCCNAIENGSKSAARRRGAIPAAIAMLSTMAMPYSEPLGRPAAIVRSGHPGRAADKRPASTSGWAVSQSRAKCAHRARPSSARNADSARALRTVAKHERAIGLRYLALIVRSRRDRERIDRRAGRSAVRSCSNVLGVQRARAPERADCRAPVASENSAYGERMRAALGTAPAHEPAVRATSRTLSIERAGRLRRGGGAVLVRDATGIHVTTAIRDRGDPTRKSRTKPSEYTA